jgi:hypothetical protein
MPWVAAKLAAVTPAAVTLAAWAVQVCLVEANPVQTPAALVASRKARWAMAWSVPVAMAVLSMVAKSGRITVKGVDRYLPCTLGEVQPHCTVLWGFFAGGGRISGEEGSGGMGTAVL